MTHLVPSNCDQITCTSMCAKEYRSEGVDTISSCKCDQNNLQICLPNRITHNGMIH
jgi:hypothetical protein